MGAGEKEPSWYKLPLNYPLLAQLRCNHKVLQIPSPHIPPSLLQQLNSRLQTNNSFVYLHHLHRHIHAFPSVTIRVMVLLHGAGWLRPRVNRFFLLQLYTATVWYCRFMIQQRSERGCMRPASSQLCKSSHEPDLPLVPKSHKTNCMRETHMAGFEYRLLISRTIESHVNAHTIIKHLPMLPTPSSMLPPMFANGG